MRREANFDGMEWGEDEPEFRRFDRPRSLAKTRFAARAVLATVLIAGLTIAAQHQMHPSPAASAAAALPHAAETFERVAAKAADAGPMLVLEPLQGEPPVRSEPPRWSPATGLREDTLFSGSFDAIDAPYLRVALTEIGPTVAPPASLFVTLTRRAAEAQGLSIIRTGSRSQVETKFGPFEIVEATLSGMGERSCTGFQSVGMRNLRIDGWLCGVLGKAPEPRAVACATDRLTMSGSAAPTIEAALAEAETRRTPGCTADEAPRTRRSEAAGSIEPRRGETRMEPKNGRAQKNEAQKRQIVQAEP